jgi:hypothetical protein
VKSKVSMLIIFFHIKGIVHEEFVLEGQTVNWLKVIRSAVPRNTFLMMFIHVYFLSRYMFRPLLAIFRQNTHLFLEVVSPAMDPLFYVLCIIRFYFNILSKFPFVSESIVLLTCWLELHRLSPEFSFDSSILAENKVSRFCIAYTYGRMVAHLVTTNQRCINANTRVYILSSYYEERIYDHTI